MKDPLEGSIAELRQLARGLLYDWHGAEDVVQEAWLAALSAPTRSERSAGWLAGAVRRLSRNRMRRDARRRSREVRSAQPEAQPAVDEHAGRIELLHLVLDALAKLPEPYRVAVMLRYFDELPPRDIARRLSLPVNTVRTHVRRGLERLRAELDGEEGRGREEWFAALVAIAGPPPATLAGGSASAPAPKSGSARHSKAALGGLALAIAVIALVIGSFPREPVGARQGARLVEGAASVVAPVVIDESTPVSASVETARTQVDGAAPASTPWIVRGAVLRNYNEPVPGVRVRGRVYAGTEPEGEPLVDRLITTDARGTYSWPIEPPTEMVRVSVELFEENVLFRDPIWDVFLPGDTLTAPWNLRMAALDCRLTGTVRNAAGEPIAGARVYDQQLLEPTHVTTDATGRYSIDYASASMDDRVRVCADGYADQVVAVNLRPGELTQDVVLVPERRVRGRVVDEFGDPVAGAFVSRNIPTDVEAVVTDEQGGFELGGFSDAHLNESFVHLSASKDGFATTRRSFRPSEFSLGELGEPLVIERGIRLSGRVVDSFGAPLPGTWVSVGYGTYPSNMTYTDADGRFELENALVGYWPLWFWRVGFAQLRRDVEVPAGADRVDRIEVALTEPHFIGGVVLDVDGQPIPYAWVSADDPKRRSRFEGFGQNADADGRFRIDGLPNSPVQLSVGRRGGAPLIAEFDEIDRDDIVLRFDPAGVLRGIVTDESGRAVTRFTVRVVRSLGRQSTGLQSTLFESSDGTWEISERIPADGRFLIEVRADGFVPAPTVAKAGPRTEPPVAVRLERGATIAGSVIDASTGLPLEDALVRARGPWDQMETGGRPRSTRTDANGRFELRDIESGAVQLHVATREWGHIDGPFEVDGTAPIERHIEFGGAGRIVGCSLSADGSPRAGESISLYASDVETDERHGRTLTNGEGGFVFERLRPGLYAVGREVSDGTQSYRDSSQDVAVRVGEDSVVELRPAGRAEAVVRVHAASGLPDAVIVRLSHRMQLGDSIAEWNRTALATGGEARFYPIEGGTTSVNAWARLTNGAWLRGFKGVEIPTRGRIEIDLELERDD